MFSWEVDFPFRVNDPVTVIERYWTTDKDEDDVYVHGILTAVEGTDGCYVILEGEESPTYFAFAEIEGVIPGDRIPFLSGTTKRSDYPPLI